MEVRELSISYHARYDGKARVGLSSPNARETGLVRFSAYSAPARRSDRQQRQYNGYTPVGVTDIVTR